MGARRRARRPSGTKVSPLLEKNCGTCHDAESGLPEVTKPDVEKSGGSRSGASIATFTRVSHIHLFGISFYFPVVGWIFGMADFNQRWKLIFDFNAVCFLVLDVASWWLTKSGPAAPGLP